MSNVATMPQRSRAGLNLSGQEVDDVTFAGRVHDLGKLFIPIES